MAEMAARVLFMLSPVQVMAERWLSARRGSILLRVEMPCQDDAPRISRRCRRLSARPPRATHKSGRASAQADWLRRRRISTNEPIASPPSAMTGMTKRALGIVPPHCRSDG
jgi:hypothetical protein